MMTAGGIYNESACIINIVQHLADSKSLFNAFYFKCCLVYSYTLMVSNQYTKETKLFNASQISDLLTCPYITRMHHASVCALHACSRALELSNF